MESLKINFAVITNAGFDKEVWTIQQVMHAKGLDREEFMEPPKDVKEEGKIWKLKKLLFGLNNT